MSPYQEQSFRKWQSLLPETFLLVMTFHKRTFYGHLCHLLNLRNNITILNIKATPSLFRTASIRKLSHLKWAASIRNLSCNSNMTNIKIQRRFDENVSCCRSLNTSKGVASFRRPWTPQGKLIKFPPLWICTKLGRKEAKTNSKGRFHSKTYTI
jgi:hypothetical protein